MWKLSKEAKIRLLAHYENIINGRKFSWENHNFTIEDFEYFIKAKFSVLNTYNLLNAVETKELNTLSELKERSDFSYEVWEDDYWEINFKKMLFSVLSGQCDLFEKRLKMNVYSNNVNINERNHKNGKSLLMLSAKYFSFEHTKKLIEEYRANPHLLDDNYLNCLFYAAQNPCSKTLEFLLDKKIDLNPCNENIFMWLNNNNACCVKKLFELGVDINAPNKIGETILDRLYNKSGREKIIQELQKIGAKRNYGKKYLAPMAPIHADKEDRLLELDKLFSYVQELKKGKIRKSKEKSEMYNGLSEEQAATFQHYENMLADVKNGKFISFDGIDVVEFKIFLDWEYKEFRIKEISGQLEKNSTKGCEEISELYHNFDFKDDVDSYDCAEMLFREMFNYINNNQWYLFEKELKNGFNINTQSNFYNKTLLMLSAKYCSFEKTQRLIKKYRANPHLLDRDYLNCLFYATQNSCNKTLEFLLNQEVDVTPVTEYGRTLLMYLKNNNAHCIKKLIELGVNADAEDQYGSTALDIMKKSFKCDKVIEILENINAKNNYGKKHYIYDVSVQADKTDDSYRQLIELISKQSPLKNKKAQKRLEEELDFIKENKFANLFLLFYLIRKNPQIEIPLTGNLEAYFYILYYLGVSKINPLELKLFKPQTVKICRNLCISFSDDTSILELEKLDFIIDIYLFKNDWYLSHSLSSYMSLKKINDYFQTFFEISEEEMLCFWEGIKKIENQTLESINKFFRKKHLRKLKGLKFNYYEQYSKALLTIFDNNYFKTHSLQHSQYFSKDGLEELCKEVKNKNLNINHFVYGHKKDKLLPAPYGYYSGIAASYLIHWACKNNLVDELIKISNQKESQTISMA